MQRTVYIKTTDSCNLNCKHCFTGGNGPDRKFLDVDGTLRWVVEHTLSCGRNDHVHYELHGGEPFLAPVPMLKDVVRGLRNYGHVNQSIGATTNLTYKLTDDLLSFIVNDIDSIATSWDKGIRFANPKQEELWFNNLKKLLAVKPDVVLNVSLSRAVLEMDTDELIVFLKSTGCYKVLFDRITINGNAKDHLEMFPTNAEINQWYLRMHESTVKLDARKWFHNAALEDVYAKFEKGNPSCGTFCRDCEERLLTVNADGTIGGCPNAAPEESFGDIHMPIQQLLKSAKRVDLMLEERSRSPICFTCPVFSVCGSDCHRLAWDGDVCASPKQLMLKLAGMEYSTGSHKPRRVIPIMNI